ncbi:MAG: abortive infection family protein [Candidatus Obscuribacterales bacterium]|nr:abortive infection family protein [Candidatus Obscuribacterales bacterium]
MTEIFALPQFKMHGARHVIELAGGAIHIQQQVEALEEAVMRSPNLALDLARSLVESVCETILTDLEKPVPKGMDDRLKAVFDQVLICPTNTDEKEKVEGALQSLRDGLNTSIGGITTLRHAAGLSSHGKDGHTEPLAYVHAAFVAQSADAIVAFLYRCHRFYKGVPKRLMRYEDDPTLNDYIDDSNELVQIFEAAYKPSEVLFNLDRDAYKNALIELAQQVAADIEQEKRQQAGSGGHSV